MPDLKRPKRVLGVRSPIIKHTYSIEIVIIKYKTCHGNVTLVSKLLVKCIKVVGARHAASPMYLSQIGRRNSIQHLSWTNTRIRKYRIGSPPLEGYS